MLHFCAVPAPPFTGETDSHTSLSLEAQPDHDPKWKPLLENESLDLLGVAWEIETRGLLFGRAWRLRQPNVPLRCIQISGCFYTIGVFW